MNTQKARELYLDYLNTIFHQRRVEEVGRFYTDDVVAHPAFPGSPGLPALKAAVQMWLDAFSDMHVTLDGLLYDDGFVAARITITAVHTGPFLGVPATGRRIEVIDQPHYRLRDGKFAELWDAPDLLTMLRQIGAISLPG